MDNDIDYFICDLDDYEIWSAYDEYSKICTEVTDEYE